MSIIKLIMSKIRYLTKGKSTTIDIYSKKFGVAGRLSNFTKRCFVFEGVLCNSIEGFLQSLKFQDEGKQKEICTLYGVNAKLAGAIQEWTKTQTLYWKGIPYKRDSMNYQSLLDRLYLSV